MSFKLISWNIRRDSDCSPELQRAFGWQTRKDHIFAVLGRFRLSQHKVVYCLQEASDESMPDILKFFEESHFSFVTKESSQWIVFAHVRSTGFRRPLYTHFLPYPDPRAGSSWLVTTFFDYEEDGLTVPVTVINVQFPIDTKYRLAVTEHVCQEITQITSSLDLTILCGDMNTWSDEEGYE